MEWIASRHKACGEVKIDDLEVDARWLKGVKSDKVPQCVVGRHYGGRPSRSLSAEFASTRQWVRWDSTLSWARVELLRSALSWLSLLLLTTPAPPHHHSPCLSFAPAPPPPSAGRTPPPLAPLRLPASRSSASRTASAPRPRPLPLSSRVARASSPPSVPPTSSRTSLSRCVTCFKTARTRRLHEEGQTERACRYHSRAKSGWRRSFLVSDADDVLADTQRRARSFAHRRQSDGRMEVLALRTEESKHASVCCR